LIATSAAAAAAAAAAFFSLLLPLLLLLQQHQCFCDAETAMEVAGTLSTACCCRLERQTQRTLRVLLHLFR